MESKWPACNTYRQACRASQWTRSGERKTGVEGVLRAVDVIFYADPHETTDFHAELGSLDGSNIACRDSQRDGQELTQQRGNDTIGTRPHSGQLRRLV